MRKSNSTSQLVNLDLVPHSKEQDYVKKLRFYLPGTTTNIYTSLNVQYSNNNGIHHRKGKKLPTLDTSIKYLTQLNPKLVTYVFNKKHYKHKYKCKHSSQLHDAKFNVYDKRLKNEKFEIQREQQHVTLNNSISKLKYQINKHYAKLTKLSALIEDTKIELGLLDNKIMEIEHNTNDNGDTPLMKVNAQIQKAKNDKNIQLQQLVLEYNELKQAIRNEETQLCSLKQQYNIIKNELIVHYHNLLLEGKDTRNEGLSWIIKRIWKFNEEIIMSYIPTFLDIKSVDYLFEISRLALEKDYEEDNLKDLYEKVFIQKQKKFNLSSTTNTNSNSSNTLTINCNTIKSILTKMDKQLDYIANNNHKLSFDKVETFINNNSTSLIDETTEKCIQLINDKKKYIRDIQTTIEQKRINEINRINKEYLYYDYERKFNVPIIKVISALVGEDHLDDEMNKINKEMKLFTKTLQGVRSFSFLHTQKKIN